MTDSGPTHPDAAGQTGPDNRYRNCIVCGGGPLRQLERYTNAHLVRCPACGLTFGGLRPSDQELQQHYKGYGTGWFDSDITRQRYQELLDTFEPHRRSNRILDMGCGAGYFLEEAANRGWDAVGSEFGELAIQMSRDKGLSVVQAPLQLGSFPRGHFDVITSFEVVEHLRDPMAEAQVIANLLRPGGVFYCTTPNFDSLSRRLRGPDWSAIEHPEHLIYFTRPTLKSWLGRAGFSPLRVITTGLSTQTLGNVVPVVSAPVQATAPDQALDQRARSVVESSGALRQAKSLVNRALTLTGTGDTLKGWFLRSP